MAAAPEVISAPDPEKEKEKPRKSAWGAVPAAAPPAASLADVMSEQLASEMAKEEETKARKASSESEASKPDDAVDAETLAAIAAASDDTTDDLMIAQMLQDQFDRDYDAAIASEERHANKESKVTVSYSKYRAIPDNPIWADEDSEEDEYFTQVWKSVRRCIGFGC